MSEGLLTIDVDAEIRKLCGQQFASPKDRVLELLRCLVRTGTQKLDVQVSSKSVRVTAVGLRWPEQAWHSLRKVGDAALDSSARHEALLGTETLLGAGALGLLAEPRCVLSCGDYALEWREGRLVEARGEVAHGASVTIDVRRRVKARELREHIAHACRFATLPISVEGTTVSGGGVHLEDGFSAVDFDEDGVTGRLGLPREGTVCRTRVLRHQLLTKSLVGVSPRGFVHEATIDLGDEHPMDEQLPRAVRTVLLDARSQSYRQAVERIREFEPAERRRLVEILLSCWRDSTVAQWLDTLPIFETMGGAWIAAADIESISKNGVVWAIEPGGKQSGWLAAAKEVLVLDEAAREYIFAKLGLRTASPPPRAKDRVWRRCWSWVREVVRRLREGAARVPAWLMGQTIIEPGLLSPEERELLEALQTEVQTGSVTPPYRDSARVPLCFVSRGAVPIRPLRIRGNLVFPIPRRHPLTRRAVALYQTDRSNVLPICMAVFGGLFGSRSRHREMLRAFSRTGGT